jgi:acyl carrier protein
MTEGKIRDVDDVPDAVRSSIAEILCIPITAVTPSVTLIALGAESFHFVNLAYRLDTHFGIRLPKQYGIPSGYTVDALTRAVVKQLEAPR